MTTERPNGSLYTKITDRIATIEFGHPSGNAFVRELLERLAVAFRQLSENKSVSLIILRSEGDGAFCGGASLVEMQALSNETQAGEFFGGFAQVINAMRSCDKPIIGRVHGKAVGGGVGLVAACDYVFATVQASIRLSELSIGIAPLVIAPAVERKIGISGLSELSLAPTEWKNAYWAQEKGLYAKVFDKTSEMDKELDFYTAQTSSYDYKALTTWKRTLWQGTDHWDRLLVERAGQTGNLALSETTKSALSKFNK